MHAGRWIRRLDQEIPPWGRRRIGHADPRLVALESRSAISELRSKYSWYTVRGLRHEVVELFTDDGEIENSRNHDEGPITVAGKQALCEYLLAEVPTLDGDHAEGTCGMVSLGDESFCGHSIDTFRKVPGQCLFSSRQFLPARNVHKPSAGRARP